MASRKIEVQKEQTQMLTDILDEIRQKADEVNKAHDGLEEKKYEIEELMANLDANKDTLENAIGYIEEAQNAIEDLENGQLSDAQDILGY